MTPHQIKEIAEGRFVDHLLFEQKKAYWHRLFDTSDIRARHKEMTGQKTLAHLPKNPSDFIVTHADIGMFYAEVKGTETDTFRFNRIEKSQMAGMIQQRAAGGLYYVFINQVIDNEWFVVPGDYFVVNRDMKPRVDSVKLHNWKACYGSSSPFSRIRR